MMTLSDESFGMPTRDFACILLPTVDYDSQLRAIRSLLDQHKKNEERRAGEIQELDHEILHLTDVQGQWASDDRSDMLHTSVYADAAHSMAAIGMLAPSSRRFSAKRSVRRRLTMVMKLTIYRTIGGGKPKSSCDGTVDIIGRKMVSESTIWSPALCNYPAPLA